MKKHCTKKTIVSLALTTLFISSAALSVFASPSLKGDINNDGRINNKDYTVLFRYLTDKNSVEINEVNADINSDGSINNKDYTLLFKTLTGNEIEAPEIKYEVYESNEEISKAYNTDFYVGYQTIKRRLLTARREYGIDLTFKTVNILGHEIAGTHSEGESSITNKYAIVDTYNENGVGSFTVDAESGKVIRYYSFDNSYLKEVEDLGKKEITFEEQLEVAKNLAKEFIDDIDEYKISYSQAAGSYIPHVRFEFNKMIGEFKTLDTFSVAVTSYGDIYNFNAKYTGCVSFKELPDGFRMEDAEKALKDNLEKKLDEKGLTLAALSVTPSYIFEITETATPVMWVNLDYTTVDQNGVLADNHSFTYLFIS